jgi:hypothetical protein
VDTGFAVTTRSDIFESKARFNDPAIPPDRIVL